MYSNKTIDTIHADMLGNISDTYDKSEGEVFYNATKPVAIELNKAYTALDTVIDKLSMENLSGDELEQRIYERTGLTRKTATKATGILTVTGNGTINTGALFASTTGVQFKATETKTITTSGTVNIECVSYGVIGNLPINTIKYLPITIAGITAINNNSATIGGYNAESDSDLLDRYYERIKTPATSGNIAQFKSWAKEVTGVGDARVIPLWNGDNTVKVIVIDSNKQPVSNELINIVQSYIDPNISGLGEGVAPIGCYCTVVSATDKAINVTATINKDSAYTAEQIKANIENSIIAYLKSIAFIESYVSFAKIGNAILDSAGVLDYNDLLVNSITSNISIANTEVATLGGVTLEFNEL